MRRVCVLACCLAVPLIWSGVNGAEPPLQLELRIGDSRLHVESGASTQAMIDGKPLTVEVDVLPTRRFSEAGISFEYPVHMPWEHDPPSMWTLDGNNATVIIHRGEPNDGSTANDLLDNLESSLKPKARARRSDVELSLRSGVVNGRAATITFSSSRIRTEAYVIGPPSRPMLLMLQDALDEDGKTTAEFVELRRLLAATLEISAL